MKRLAFLFIGLLVIAAPFAAGCSSSESAVETTTGTTTAVTTSAATTSATTSAPTQTATKTTTAVAAPASSCVACHTDKAKLQETASTEVVETPEEASGEG